MSRINHPAALLFVCCALSGCAGTLDKLEQVGKPPPQTQVENPTVDPGYKPLTWPMPENRPAPKQYANSLWQPGARAFFRDQRAARVGDILRVNIKLKEKAELTDQTERKRDTTDKAGAPKVLGLESRILGWLPGKATPGKLLDVSGAANTKGTGSIKRQETLETQIAALVTQILPNGNLVIDGTQEIRINNEIREVGIKGVIRPEDIKSDNTVDSTQIAQARIVYGGRGDISDAQRARWGSQVVDILAPF